MKNPAEGSELLSKGFRLMSEAFGQDPDRLGLV
jgi:hypothetical protein